MFSNIQLDNQRKIDSISAVLSSETAPAGKSEEKKLLKELLELLKGGIEPGEIAAVMNILGKLKESLPPILFTKIMKELSEAFSEVIMSQMSINPAKNNPEDIAQQIDSISQNVSGSMVPSDMLNQLKQMIMDNLMNMQQLNDEEDAPVEQEFVAKTDPTFQPTNDQKSEQQDKITSLTFNPMLQFELSKQYLEPEALDKSYNTTKDSLTVSKTAAIDTSNLADKIKRSITADAIKPVQSSLSLNNSNLPVSQSVTDKLNSATAHLIEGIFEHLIGEIDSNY